MTSNRQLTTVNEIIDALGGPRGMASLFGGVPHRFSNYKAAGRFPEMMHMRIYAECLKRGLTIAPELVGMTDELMALARGERQRRLPLTPQTGPAR
jgi:hypothetical protein